ncbi:MAG: hypothetical protein ABSG50_15780 [Opitutaceae bacterium]|jgi:hypothetical protein
MSNLTKEEELAEREYAEVGLNMRHYGNMHFAELTIFFAVNGVMLWSVAEKGASMPKVEVISTEIAGLILCFLFLQMALRVCDNWDKFLARAQELEKILSFRQYAVRPRERLFNNRRAINSIYAVVALLWLANLVPSVAATLCEHCHERCCGAHSCVSKNVSRQGP